MGHPAARLSVVAVAALLVVSSCTGPSVSPSASSASAAPNSPGATGSAAPTSIPQPEVTDLPVAAVDQRVDLAVPSFSDPTRITNPLFPVGQGSSNVLLGEVDGEPFRAEVTVLPETRIMEWNGQRIETVVSQYFAYLDGRIHEVALDLYAQADDGSVWYFGEDVFNFDEGVVADTEGTWFAGKDGPAAMIMPADPQVGDVYRPENIPGLVFEEVTVKSTGETVDGPSGPVDGAILVEELHMDGSREEKTFAPGYGEFFTGGGGDVEALALSVPTDALAGSAPAELETLSAAATDAFDATRSEDWDAASKAFADMTVPWEGYRSEGVPEMIESEMGDALEALQGAVDERDAEAAGQAAIDVARAVLDLRLRHEAPAKVDLGRLELTTRQLLLDLAAGDAAAMTGDLTTLEWIRDRVAHALGSPDVSRIDLQLGELRAAVVAEDLDAAAEATSGLRETLAGLSPTN